MAFPDVVIVLPGILGSALTKDGKEVWSTSGGAIWQALISGGGSIRSLALAGADDPTLDDLGDGIVASALLSDLTVVPGLWKVDGYTGLMTRLQQELGLVPGQNLFPFPYDWRRDNRVAARKLQRAAHDWLRAWRARSGNAGARIVLVVHSMGGLVASHFLEVLGGWKDTRALISFGTPYRGSLNALGFLANGFAKGIGPLRIDLTPVVGSFTSVYQLLPSFACIDTDDGTLKHVSDMKGLPGIDPVRAAAARDFYDTIEAEQKRNKDLPEYKASPYRTYPIVGIAQPTFQSAHFANGRVTLIQSLRGDDNGGDGTVPRVSATPLWLSDEHREIFASEAHASLQNFDAALVNLVGILTGNQIDLASVRAGPETLSVDLDDVYPSEAVTIRAVPSVKADVTARIVAQNGEPRTLELRPVGRKGGYAGTTALPPGAYRVAVTAGFPKQPVTVNDVFLVVDAAGKPAAARRKPAAGKAKAKGAAVPSATADAAPPTPPADPEASGAKPADGAPAGEEEPIFTLRITFVHGGLTQVQAPVVVAARYDGMALAGATQIYDRLLDSWVTRAIDLGLVGTGLGQIFPIDVHRFPNGGNVNAQTLLLASMGEPGRFAQDGLRFLISNIVVGVKSFTVDHFATTLIGTRRGELSIADATRAFLHGVLDGFERFRVVTAAIKDHQEQFRNASASALSVTMVCSNLNDLKAMKGWFEALTRDPALSRLVVQTIDGGSVKQDPEPEEVPTDCEPDVKTTLLRVTRGKSKPTLSGAKTPDDLFEFSAMSDLAAVPVRQADVNAYWIRVLPERLAHAADKAKREDLGRFLTNIVFPEDFRKLIESAQSLVFEVDASTARFPWEMAALQTYSQATSFLGTRIGMSRQFRTLLSPPPTAPPPLNHKLKALVIADPAGGTLALPHAREEGRAVVEVLDQVRRAWGGTFKIEVTTRIGPKNDDAAESDRQALEAKFPWISSAGTCDPLELAMLIVNEQFDLIHYAGHGFCDPRTEQAGWVFSPECFLTAKEIFRVRQVPRLVFANACFSAVTAGGKAPLAVDDQRARSVGLAQAFFARGIPNYIGTGWEVDDACARECARWFYALVLGLSSPDAGSGIIGMAPPATIGDALCRARDKTAIFRPTSSTWGAYQHYGRVSDKLLPLTNVSPPAEPDAETGGAAAPETAPAAPPPPPPPPTGPAVAAPKVNVRPPADAAAKPELVYVNGIDVETGDYAVKPRSIDDVARRVLLRPDTEQYAELHADTPRSFNVLFGVDTTKIGEAGWGVVFHEDTPDAVKAALEPLLKRRRQQAGDRYKALDFSKGEQTRGWYQRHNISAGNIDPEVVPFYLLLVGPPDLIPFEFQYLVGVEYAVGRLAFDTPAEYERYARSVVAYETGNRVPNAKQIAYWGTRHPGDPATELSASMLVTPLADGLAGAEGALKRPIGSEAGFAQSLSLGDEATRARLLETLHGAKPPAMLFTASHGMSVRSGKPDQTTTQGALLCQDWTGIGSVRPEHFLAATDVDDAANVNGLVALMFACFGAGTPDLDQFPLDMTQAGRTSPLAPSPFIAALPRRLLTHPNGSALAVIGHIDRAWGCSIQAAKTRGPQIATFRNSIGLILTGKPVGYALSGNFGARYSALSTALATATAPTVAATARPSDRELVNLWLERNDAQNFVLLGDPAVSVRTNDLQAS